MNKYNVGDVVKLRDDLEDLSWKWEQLLNKPLLINQVINNTYLVDEEWLLWASDEMIEGLWEECNNEKNVTTTIFENMNNNDNFPKQMLKLIDVLNMIAKGELKEGTKVKCNNSTFEYRKLHKDSGRNTLDLYSKNNTSLINATYLTPILSFEVELIEPPCEHEWKDIETHRMGEGIIRRFRRCVKCGLEEIEECISDTEKTSEPTKIEELKESEFYTEGAIISKLNEVIRVINKEL